MGMIYSTVKYIVSVIEWEKCGKALVSCFFLMEAFLLHHLFLTFTQQFHKNSRQRWNSNIAVVSICSRRTAVWYHWIEHTFIIPLPMLAKINSIGTSFSGSSHFLYSYSFLPFRVFTFPSLLSFNNPPPTQRRWSPINTNSKTNSPVHQITDYERSTT